MKVLVGEVATAMSGFDGDFELSAEATLKLAPLFLYAVVLLKFNVLHRVALLTLLT